MGSFLAVLSSVLYAIGLLMVSTLLEYFHWSPLDSSDRERMGIITTFALPLTWIICGLSVLTDGFLLLLQRCVGNNNNNQTSYTIGHGSLEEKGEKEEKGKKEWEGELNERSNETDPSVRNNLILSSVLYCCTAIAYVYVAKHLGAALQSAIDSLQIVFLVLFNCLYLDCAARIRIGLGFLVYLSGIYLLSFDATTNKPVDAATFILGSFVIVLLMTYNGMLFERGIQLLPVIKYLFLQSLICFALLTIACLSSALYFGLLDLVNPVGKEGRTLLLYALVKHFVGIAATYSEAFAIKMIGYQQYVMIQTITYPLASFLLQCIFLTTPYTEVWTTLVGLTLVAGGLFFLQTVSSESKSESKDEEKNLLIN